VAASTRVSKEHREAVKKAYRYLPSSLSLKEVHARLAATTGVKFSSRTLQRWIKDEGWERDLADAVKKETHRKMVENAVSTGAKKLGTQPETTDERIEAAAEAASIVLLSHQDSLSGLRGIYDELQKDLADQVLNKHMAVKDADSGEIKLVAPSLDYGIKQLRRLTQTQGDIIKLERLAHGLDDESTKDDDSDVLRELAEELAGDDTSHEDTAEGEAD